MGIDEIVDGIFEGGNEVPKHKEAELRKILFSLGYEYGIVDRGVYSKKDGSHTHLLIEANLRTGEEGYSYTEIFNDVQMEAFRQANENVPITSGQKAMFITSALAPIAGTLYAFNDLPYSAYVAGGSFIAFAAGFRVAAALMLRNQYQNAEERFNLMNFVTDQKEAVSRALLAGR